METHSKINKQPLAYWNHQWIEADALGIPFDDLGFLQGVTIVERMRTFRHEVFRLEQHMQRLQRSLEIVGWDAIIICDEIARAVDQLLPKNKDLLHDGDDWTITAIVTPGKTPDASQPTLCVHGHPLPFNDWAHQYEQGIEIVLGDVRQVPNNCWPAELKCRSRMHFYLADRQAHAVSSGARAILLDQNGNVGEASTANVVIYNQERGLVTPRRQNVLPGISLQVLFELADQLDIPWSEADISPEEFGKAKEAFLTSTSVCLLPIVRSGGDKIGTGEPGAIYRRLLGAWCDLAEVDICQQAYRFASRH